MLNDKVLLSRRCAEHCAPAPMIDLSYFRFCICTTEGQPPFESLVPRFTSSTNAPGTIGVPFSFTVRATNMHAGDTFSESGLPAWATLDPATGVITGTPTPPPANTAVQITATNAEGYATQTLNVRIAAVVTTVGPGKFGTLMVDAIPDAAMIQAFAGTVNNPTSGSTMVVPLPVGGWGRVFAYPDSLGPATSIINNMMMNVTGGYNRPAGDPNGESPIIVDIGGEDYRVYYVRNAAAAPVAGTTDTLTI